MMNTTFSELLGFYMTEKHMDDLLNMFFVNSTLINLFQLLTGT